MFSYCIKTTKRTVWRSRRSCIRYGLTQVEVVVSATLLMAVMGVIPSLGFHLNRIAKESRHYQLAVQELANQLERLTNLSPDQLKSELQDLSLPIEVHDSLPGATLDAELVADSKGTRVVLSLQWDRTGSPPPVQLVGWIDTEPALRVDTSTTGDPS